MCRSSVWEILTAVGTVGATVFSAIGIWFSLWKEKRKLRVFYQSKTNEIYISNVSSLTCIVYSVSFFAKDKKFYEDFNQIKLFPSETISIKLDKSKLLKKYTEQSFDVLCDNKDDSKVRVVLSDSLGRTYKLNEDFRVFDFLTGDNNYEQV